MSAAGPGGPADPDAAGEGPVDGVVRVWHEDRGWGVVDSPQTPGGCRADAASVEEGPGVPERPLRAGEPVLLRWRPSPQGDLPFQAVSVRRRGDDVLGAAPGA